MSMPLSRLMRGTLAVLLLWPVLSYALLLTLHTSDPRASLSAGDSCCSVACRTECGSCGTDAGACGLSGPAGSTCDWGATPCHSPKPSAHATFGGFKSTPPPAVPLADDHGGERVSPVDPASPAMRSIPTPERPPAA